MGGFKQYYEKLEGLGATIVVASADPQDKATELATDLPFPVAFGVTRAQADELGSWWEERRQIIQPSNFVLDNAGQVLSATYSTGPIGRLEPADAVKFIEFQEKQKRVAC